MICHKNMSLLCFCLLKGDKKTLSLVQKIFLFVKNIFCTNENFFLSPFNKQKQRLGELEFKYFGGSDVVNKLKVDEFFYRNFSSGKENDGQTTLVLCCWFEVLILIEPLWNLTYFRFAVHEEYFFLSFSRTYWYH